MAENIYIEFTADTTGLKAAQNELDALKTKITGVTTEGAKNVGNFSQRLKEGKAAIQLMSGAMGLFGDKSQAVVQIIHKVHAALNLLKGVNTLTGLSAAFSGVTLSVNGARAAVTALNTAIKSNPFGLLLSAISTVVVAMGFFNDETDEANENIKKLSNSLQSTFESAQKTMKRTNDEYEIFLTNNQKLLELNDASGELLLSNELKLIAFKKERAKQEVEDVEHQVKLNEALRNTADIAGSLTKEMRESHATFEKESINLRESLNGKLAALDQEAAILIAASDKEIRDKQNELRSKAEDDAIKERERLWKYSNERFKQGWIDWQNDLAENDKRALEWKKANDIMKELFVEWNKDISNINDEIADKENKKVKETDEKKKELREQIARETVAALSEIWTAYSQQNIEEIEHELEAKNEMFDMELEKNQERRDREIISDREFRAKEKELLAQKERAEREAQKRILAEKRKMALIEKAESLFNIGISTAKNIIQQPGLYGELIPFWIALGAIQAGVVAATPLPKYASGTLSLQRGSNPVGTDTIPVLANEGEAITPTSIAKDYNTTLAAMHRRSIPHKVMNDFVKNYSMKYYNKNETNFDYEKLGASLAYHLRGKDSMKIKNIDDFARVFSSGNNSPFRT